MIEETFIKIIETQGISSGLCLVLLALLYKQLQETACIKHMLLKHVMDQCEELERMREKHGRS